MNTALPLIDLCDLPTGTKFTYPGSPPGKIYEARGSGWYSSVEGFDGGPWHRYRGQFQVLPVEHPEALERELRRARQEVFSPDEAIAAKASEKITACKAKLLPWWDLREERAEHERGQRLFYTWA